MRGWFDSNPLLPRRALWLSPAWRSTPGCARVGLAVCGVLSWAVGSGGGGVLAQKLCESVVVGGVGDSGADSDDVRPGLQVGGGGAGGNAAGGDVTQGGERSADRPKPIRPKR